jgi:hypothetical protein
MLLAPHPRSTAAEGLRLLACWLVLILMMQGFGAAQALGRGPLHRHVNHSAATALDLRHADHHFHSTTERHHHGADDTSVQVVTAAPDGAIDAAAFALTAALALMATTVARMWRDTRRHVWRPAPTWAWCSHIPTTLFRPPRKA